MKTAFSYNLLKHLRNKKEEGGFTLIELLVVIIIIGILAAIALPSFLNQANRARESEASNYVGAQNRGQQAYFLEELQYADDVASMDVGIPTETDNYFYGGTNNNTGDGLVTRDGTGADTATFFANPRKDPLKGFVGLVYTNDASQSQNSEICRADDAGIDTAVTVAPAADGSIDCTNGENIGG